MALLTYLQKLFFSQPLKRLPAPWLPLVPVNPRSQVSGVKRVNDKAALSLSVPMSLSRRPSLPDPVPMGLGALGPHIGHLAHLSRRRGINRTDPCVAAPTKCSFFLSYKSSPLNVSVKPDAHMPSTCALPD